MTIGRIQLELLEDLIPDAMSDAPWLTVNDLSDGRSLSRRSVYEALNRLVDKGCLIKQKSSTRGHPLAFRVTQKGVDAFHRAIFDKNRVPGVPYPDRKRARRDWHMGDPRQSKCRDRRFVCYDRLTNCYWLGTMYRDYMYFYGVKPVLEDIHEWPEAWIWFPYPDPPKGRTFWIKG